MSGIVTKKNRYYVYVTPRTDQRTYGQEIDISDYILSSGIGKITRSIDSSDYNVGIFVSADVTIKGQNYNGYLNDQSDNRSIFKYSRDLAKVRIVYSNPAGDTIQFKGLINEAATVLDAMTSLITFKVLSLDSVLRTTSISGGLVSDGLSAKQTMISILSQAQIASVLNIDPANINPNFNFNVDLGSGFDGLTVQDGLNQLLVTTNSCMLIDDNENLFIRSRAITQSQPILNLYGPYDIYRRQNTIDLTNFNNGIQRMFTSFQINTETAENSPNSEFYGFNQKSDTFGFITDSGTEQQIAQELVNEFSYPKLECQVDIPVHVAPNVQLLDAVALNWPLLIKPWPNCFMPVVGITKIGETSMPLPVRYGPLDISPNVAWKVIQIDDDPTKFIKSLKLRQAGIVIGDGYFTIPGNSLVDYAIIDASTVGGSGTTSYNPSIVGAAQVGNTMI
jgi:hypothetical protein